MNAEKHGFYEEKKRIKKFEIIFCIKKSKNRPVAIIEYENNGKSFNITENEYVKLFTKSQKSKGSGIGGNYISRIIKAHGGGMKIDENFHSGFRMNIEIPLPEKD